MLRNLSAAVLTVLLGAVAADAHELSTSYSAIRVDGTQAAVTFTINPVEMHNGPQLDADGDSAVSAAELDQSLDVLTAAILDHYRLSLPGGEPVAPERTGYDYSSGAVVSLELLYQFDADATDLRIASTLDVITQDDHRHLLQIGEGSDARQTVLSRDYPGIDVDYTMGIPLWVTMSEFMVLGIEHIFTGYDHLAFLLALLVAASRIGDVVRIVTAFTIGHIVTLALATLDVVVLPSRLIESMIALSIAYVAVENFLGRRLVHRWVITFLFGLVHGFGFSNILRELGLASTRLATSLFSFNIGVELGQLAFVAIVFPAILYAARTRYKEAVMTTASVIVMSLGFYWFIQRAVFG